MKKAQNFINYALIKERLGEYARKVGRAAARPAILLWYVMRSKDTPRSDKMMIFSALAYLVLPIDLLDAKRLPIIGWLDEMVSLSVAYQKVCKYITPEIELKADRLLDKWIPEDGYVNYVEVLD